MCLNFDKDFTVRRPTLKDDGGFSSRTPGIKREDIEDRWADIRAIVGGFFSHGPG